MNQRHDCASVQSSLDGNQHPQSAAGGTRRSKIAVIRISISPMIDCEKLLIFESVSRSYAISTVKLEFFGARNHFPPSDDCARLWIAVTYTASKTDFPPFPMLLLWNGSPKRRKSQYSCLHSHEWLFGILVLRNYLLYVDRRLQIRAIWFDW